MTARPDTPAPLPARDAYRRWAEHYDHETVISALEDRAVSHLSPPTAGRALLDAGCGTGRRLAATAADARRPVGVDLVPEMLRAGRHSRRSDSLARVELVAGDLHALPLRAGLFDLVWCRLAIGHIPDPEPVYAELGRVSRPGADLVVTDFHPAAAAAGHVRSFRDAGGALHAIVHHAHEEADQRAAAEAAGWTVTAVRHLTPGEAERPFYERAGRLAEYEAHQELPLVLALCLTR